MRIVNQASMEAAEFHFKNARAWRQKAATRPRQAAKFNALADEWQFEGSVHWLRALGRNVVAPQREGASA